MSNVSACEQCGKQRHGLKKLSGFGESFFVCFFCEKETARQGRQEEKRYLKEFPNDLEESSED